MPRWLVKHYFWVCLWRCFQKTFSIWINWLKKKKIALSAKHAAVIYLFKSPKGTQRWRKNECALFLSWDIPLLLPSNNGASDWADCTLGSCGSQASGFGLDLQHQCPPASSLSLAGHGTPQPPSSRSHSLPVNLLLCVYIYVLLVLFLWRTVTNASVKPRWRRRCSCHWTHLHHQRDGSFLLPGFFIWSHKASSP